MPSKAKQNRVTEDSLGKLLLMHANLKGMVRHCTFSGRLILQFPVPGDGIGKGFQPRSWMDVDTTQLVQWLYRQGFDRVDVGVVNRSIEAHAWRERYSSAVERLDCLPDWDGVPRLDVFLALVCGLDDSEYHRQVSRCFFLSIVARIMKPGCKVDTMLILEGPQGGYKSQLLRVFALNDHWFSDSLPHNLASKDAKQHLAGKLIIEMSEIAQMDGSTKEALKAFLSAQDDQYRPSYGRHEVVQLRQCVFVGTTNEDAYLRDVTGNRRYWPIKCGAIELDRARRNIEQVYAEALAAFHEEPVWWFEDGVNHIAEEEQKARYQEDIWVKRLTIFIRDTWNMVPKGSECLISVHDCIDHMGIETKDQTRMHQMRVAEILKSKGGQRVKRTGNHNLRFYTYLFIDLSQL